MTFSRDICPSEPVLIDLLKGATDDALQAELEHHLSECDSCRIRLQNLTDNEWRALLSAPDDSTESTGTAFRACPEPPPSDGVSETHNSSDTSQGRRSVDPGEGSAMPGRPSRSSSLHPANPQLPGLQLLEQLGRGGMATVYRARQLRLNRIVAVKLIEESVSQPDRWIRFRQEAQAAAQLQHKNIVSVFDTGFGEGYCWIVQEYCAGGTLLDRIRAAPLAAHEAAETNLHLADAVQHAHDVGIIHRDIKPANVLFSAQTPRLADFGVARLIDAEGVTQTGEAIGTPGYMSPEQACGTSGQAGPPADVYGLGALLYESLTGVPPFRAPTAVETLRMVVEQDPVAPRRLQPSIPRDLEVICLKCLEKQPERRYSSARELHDDLQRFLTGRPILARPTRFHQRVLKWTRRHPALATASAIAVTTTLALASLWLGYTRETTRLNSHLTTRNQELNTANNELRALNEQLETQQAEILLQSQYAQQSATLAGEQERASSQMVAFLMNDVLQKIAEQLPPDPTVEGDSALRRYRRLLQSAAEGMSEDRVRRAFPQSTATQSQFLMQLAQALRSSNADHAAIGFYERAAAAFAELVPDPTVHFDAYAPLEIVARNDLGRLLMNAGRMDEAEAAFRTALDRASSTQGSPSNVVAITEHNLVGLLRVTNRLDEAHELAQKVVQDLTVVNGAEDFTVAGARATLAQIQADRGNLTEAANILQQVTDQLSRLLGAGHRRTLSARHNLADVLARNQDSVRAAELRRQNLQLAEESLGATHTQTINYRSAVGHSLLHEGEFSNAELVFRQAVQHYAAASSEAGAQATINRLDAIRGLAVALIQQQRFGEAREILQEGSDIAESRLGAFHPDRLALLALLVDALLALGEPAAAEQMLKTELLRLQQQLPAEEARKAELENLLQRTRE